MAILRYQFALNILIFFREKYLGNGKNKTNKIHCIRGCHSKDRMHYYKFAQRLLSPFFGTSHDHLFKVKNERAKVVASVVKQVTVTRRVRAGE